MIPTALELIPKADTTMRAALARADAYVCEPSIGVAVYCADSSPQLMVYVAPAFRRRGHATRLVDTVLAMCRAPVATVYRGTESAHAFWATFGERVR